MPRTPALVAMSALAALTVALPAVAQSRLTPRDGAAPAIVQAHGAQVIDVPAGATVIVLPAGATALPARSVALPPGFVPVAAPVPPAFGMIRQMMAEMDALMAMPMPDPQQLIDAAMRQGAARGFAGDPILARDGAAVPAPGSVLVTTISTPAGTCQQMIRTGAPGPDGRPVTQVSRSGGACDALMPLPAGMTETTPNAATPTPAPVPATPALRRPDQPRLWTVSTDPQPIAPPARPRT
ncbi:MAG: hypothetical protein J0H19_08745 [Rhodospirillales bacterium]|nr:hypothetical protein [Rhodospirillales bacterium]